MWPVIILKVKVKGNLEKEFIELKVAISNKGCWLQRTFSFFHLLKSQRNSQAYFIA